MSADESYKPSGAEIEKAEKSMSYEQALDSHWRNVGIRQPNFHLESAAHISHRILEELDKFEKRFAEVEHDTKDETFTPELRKKIEEARKIVSEVRKNMERIEALFKLDQAG